jgi:hypothetical protein
VLPLCPIPFDEPFISGLLGGGMAGSGWADGETGVASGLVPGTVLGVVFGVKFGLVPGVTLGFGDASGVVSGGMVLLGFVPLLGLTVVGLWVCGIVLLCAPMEPDGPGLLPAPVCASAQQPHSKSAPVKRRDLRFMVSPLV